MAIEKDHVVYEDETPFDREKLHSISEIGKAIRHKKWSTATREAMAQQGEALVKLMTETGGNPDAELVAARGPFSVLHEREDAQEAAIEAKFGKSDATEYLESVTVVPETFATLAAIKLKYPNGANGLMVAADDGHKYIWNGTEWQDAGAYQANGSTLRSRPAVLITKGAVNINTITKSLEFDGQYLAVSDGYEQYQLTQYANKSLTIATDGLLVYDTVGNALKVVAAAINVLDTDLEIGYLYFDKNKFWIKSIFTVDGVAYLPKRSITNTMVTSINKPCVITAAQDIIIDTVNRKLIMPDIDTISLTYGLTVTNLADTLRGAQIDISFNGNSSGWLFVNPFDKQFHTSFDEDLDENSYLLGAIWWDKLKFDLNFTFKVNGGDYYGMLQGRYGRCKTIAALGDSLTEGVTGTDESGAEVRHPYTEYLPQYTGCIVDNFGVGSSRVQLSEGAPVLSFVERIVDIPQHDYLILFGGMNDWRGSLPLGDLADVSDVYDDISVCDTHTFTGALEYCINYWLNKFVDSNIFLCTIPLENRGATHSFAKNGLGLVQSDYNDKIRELSNRYSLPLIDMWQLGISPYNKAQSSRWMQDGMHYRSGGYEKMAQYIAGEIKRHVY